MESIRVKLDAVDDYSSHLYQSCKALAARVEEADRNIKSFMDQANELEAKRTMYSTQSEEVETFLSKYHLNDSEILLLQNARLDVANEARSFYTTFSKLQQAYQDCKVITEKQFYGIGFELLEVLGKHQETAYEKLFFWFKGKCEALAEDTSQLSAAQQNQYQYLYGQLQTAARLLQHVPSYVEQCQELLIDARRTSLVQAFMVVALQGIAAPSPSASSSGSVHGAVHGSGDSPVQFLGGLLAWVHQAVAIETEFYAGVTSSQRKKPAATDDGVASVGSGSANVGYSLEELVVRTVQGVGRPLRMRILQLLETHVASWDVLYALADLLVFYQQLFARSMLQSENAINATLKGCFQECERLFQGQIRRFVESVRGQSSQYASLLPSPSGAAASNSAMASANVDLQASLWTRECAIHVKALLKSAATALSSLPHDGVPASSTSLSPSGSGEAEATSPKFPTQQSTLSIASVLGDIVTPCLQACRVAGQGLALATSEMAVFMLNNIAALQVCPLCVADPSRGDSQLRFTCYRRRFWTTRPPRRRGRRSAAPRAPRASTGRRCSRRRRPRGRRFSCRRRSRAFCSALTWTNSWSWSTPSPRGWRPPNSSGSTWTASQRCCAPSTRRSSRRFCVRSSTASPIHNGETRSGSRSRRRSRASTRRSTRWSRAPRTSTARRGRACCSTPSTACSCSSATSERV